MRSMVSTRVELWLARHWGPARAVGATLAYHQGDPLAVTLTIQGWRWPYAPRTWVFGRDLLVQGLQGPAGQGGRVQVGPHEITEWLVLVLTDTLAADPIPLYVERRKVADFVAATRRLVPLDAEASHADAELERLLPVMLGGAS